MENNIAINIDRNIAIKFVFLQVLILWQIQVINYKLKIQKMILMNQENLILLLMLAYMVLVCFSFTG